MTGGRTGNRCGGPVWAGGGPADGGSGRPRFSAATSTACCPPPDDFALTPTQPAQTLTAGGSATFSVHRRVVSGRPGPVTLHATGLRTGMSAIFSPATVRPGQGATMTVSTTAAARNGGYPLTVAGTDAGATEYAAVGVTGTGGVDIAIGGLSVADAPEAALWSVQPGLSVGQGVNTDAPAVKFTTIPVEVAGAPWIRTPNASRPSTVDPLVTFTVNVDATVALALDTRVGRRPWMDPSWVDTGVQLVALDGSTYRYLEVFEKPFPAGTVALGPEADPTGAGAMYVVAVL